MNPSSRVAEITVSRTVNATYFSVEERFRIGSSDLVTKAFPRAQGDDLSDVEASLHLRRPKSLRLPARLEFQTPSDGTRKHAIHLRWQARYLPRLFPAMEADISLRPVGSERTEVVFTGTYRPPFGLLGLIGDQLVGVAAARSTAEQFLGDIGRAIEEGAAT